MQSPTRRQGRRSRATRSRLPFRAPASSRRCGRRRSSAPLGSPEGRALIIGPASPAVMAPGPPIVLNIALGLSPVLVLLAVLVVMDSFKLVRPVSIVLAMAIGALAAFAGTALHDPIIRATELDPAQFSRYVAPVIEETLKGLFVVVLIAGRRVGFLVDAAVQGFAVGTGFAIVENLEYLDAMPDARVFLWVVRGLGTAVL